MKKSKELTPEDLKDATVEISSFNDARVHFKLNSDQDNPLTYNLFAGEIRAKLACIAETIINNPECKYTPDNVTDTLNIPSWAKVIYINYPKVDEWYLSCDVYYKNKHIDVSSREALGYERD